MVCRGESWAWLQMCLRYIISVYMLNIGDMKEMPKKKTEIIF